MSTIVSLFFITKLLLLPLHFIIILMATVTIVMGGGEVPSTDYSPLTRAVEIVALHQADGYSVSTPSSVTPSAAAVNPGTKFPQCTRRSRSLGNMQMEHRGKERRIDHVDALLSLNTKNGTVAALEGLAPATPVPRTTAAFGGLAPAYQPLLTISISNLIRITRSLHPDIFGRTKLSSSGCFLKIGLVLFSPGRCSWVLLQEVAPAREHALDGSSL